MISPRRCILYSKSTDKNVIRVEISKNKNITTYWYKSNYKKAHEERIKSSKKLKINGCAICGYNKCDTGLDFHHVNPQDKKFRLNISNMGRKNKALVEELNKCILLCANCHREIHDKERIK